jgi:hypothetical protein
VGKVTTVEIFGIQIQQGTVILSVAKNLELPKALLLRAKKMSQIDL